MKKLALYSALMCSLSAVAETTTLSGQLTDDNGNPVANALIRFLNAEESVRTDADGRFELNNLETGNYEVDVEISAQNHFITTISHDGNPITINTGEINLDKLVVSSNPLEHNTLQMTTPVTIIGEDDLVLDRGLSINETLERIPGVNSGSFGVGAGQPVIRGQQGNRVTVLNNNTLVQDAGNVSPDHWITTEPLLAKRIEVLKGPATLLYGGQAVGGVVNVIDNTIPTEKPDGIDGGFEFRVSDDTLDARSAVGSLDFSLTENLVAHADYYKTETNSYEIPGFAESARLRAAEEAEGGEHGEEEEEAFGLLENSDLESEAFSFGISRITDAGFWGVSYQQFDRNYGIPGHAHEEEHGEEEHGEEEHGEEEGEEEEIVRLDLEKSVFNLRGQHRFEQGFFNELNFSYSLTDYKHVELEGDEIGTTFDNEADETRLELLHNDVLGFSGAFGFQLTNRDFSALGEEAYILPSDTRTFGIFMIEETDFDRWHLEFGLRYDYQEVDPVAVSSFDEEAFSASIGANIKLTDHWSLPINFSSAQRLPTAEEYFSNQFIGDELVPHLATSAVEIGDPDLDKETANNFDIGIRYRNEGWAFNAALFFNDIDDFIFLNPTGEEAEGFPVFIYDQQDAEFDGYEVELSYDFSDSYNNQWQARFFTDETTAELNDGSNVPRIPAQRVGVGLSFARGGWASNLDYVLVDDQDDVTEFELPTDSYDLLNLDISYVFLTGTTETTLFLRGNNLLDEEIRDHASFIKDIAPRPGRSISAGVRFNF
ncbi:TonB-dependent receptor [Marinicella sp. W31]|uniref:TonB-dependent receptor n=1 Tax=Marinicella sp. W31 TaxID=3023713 RepID=UPI003757D436